MTPLRGPLGPESILYHHLLMVRTPLSPNDGQLPPGQYPLFRRALLRWYGARKRTLPWRDSTDPYRVWISEIMLQQTTVKAVIPYYQRFLDAFPTVESLAAAPLDAVLARWSGLGYYSRARNLHRAAREVAERHGGAFPRDMEAARALPGIGPYTAAAILSIAYDRPHPVVDGNVIRVAARLGHLPGQAKSSGLLREVRRLTEELIDVAAPGDFNQAMMELGATLCTPRSPDCPDCPVASWCAARAAGAVDRVPEPTPRPDTVSELRAVFVIRTGDRILLRRRPTEAGLMAGLWELPDLPLQPDESGLFLPAARLAAELSELLGVRVEPGNRLGQLRHSIMNRRIRLEILTGASPGTFRPPAPWAWVHRDDIPGLGTSSIVTKVLRLMGETTHASALR